MDYDKMNENNDAINMLREAQELLDEATALIRDAVRGTSVDGAASNWLLPVIKLAAHANIDRLAKRLERENSEEAGKP